MFEHVMQLNPAFIDKRYIQDSEGRSLFHTVCECCPSGDSPVSLQMTEVLLFFRFDVTLRDRLQRKATDLVPPHSKLYKELQKKTYGICHYLDSFLALLTEYIQKILEYHDQLLISSCLCLHFKLFGW